MTPGPERAGPPLGGFEGSVGWRPDALALLLVAAALAMAVHTTHDLTWPPRWDF